MTLQSFVLGTSLVVLAAAPAGAQPAPALSSEFFETRIRPVLSSKCYACHSSKLAAPKGELVLDTNAGVLKGGTLGPAVVPGKPGESRLLEALSYSNAHLQMPPAGKLADAIIADFELWIAAGAPDPRTDSAVAAAGPGRRVVGETELALGRQWWAFQPVREQPALQGTTKAGTKLDHFVLAKLSEKRLTPSPEADPRTLIRRAYVDLIGLKPTYEEVEAYATDPSPDSYETAGRSSARVSSLRRALGPLLAGRRALRRRQPGQHHQSAVSACLAVSRLGDRKLEQGCSLRSLREAAAGGRPHARHVAVRPARAGHHRPWPQDHKDVRLSVDVVGTLQLNDWDERLDTVSRGLLGLSVACARCHDHKFDPIRQQDYYRLESVFASTQRALRPFFEIDPKTETRFMWVYQRMFDLHYTANLLESDPGSKPEQAARQVKKFRQELAALQAEIDAMSKAVSAARRLPQDGAVSRRESAAADLARRRRSPAAAEKKALPPRSDRRTTSECRTRVRTAGSRKRIDPKAPFLNSVYDAGLWFDDSEPDLTFFDAKPGVPRDLPLFQGGNLNTPGDPAPRGFPLVLAKGPADFQNGSGRLELGEKIFTDAAPLSARVIVNRVWGWHFGKHLVGTPSDFGAQGLPADASRAAGRSVPRDSSPTAGRSSGCIARSCCRPPTGSRAGRAPRRDRGRPDQPAGCGA